MKNLCESVNLWLFHVHSEIDLEVWVNMRTIIFPFPFSLFPNSLMEHGFSLRSNTQMKRINADFVATLLFFFSQRGEGAKFLRILRNGIRREPEDRRGFCATIHWVQIK